MENRDKRYTYFGAKNEIWGIFKNVPYQKKKKNQMLWIPENFAPK